MKSSERILLHLLAMGSLSALNAPAYSVPCPVSGEALDGGRATVQAKTAITSLAFSPDGSRLAVGTYQAVRLLDTATRKTLALLPGHTGSVTSLAFSPNGEILAAAGGSPGRSGEIKLW